jgi:hypothetical protein
MLKIAKTGQKILLHATMMSTPCVGGEETNSFSTQGRLFFFRHHFAMQLFLVYIFTCAVFRNKPPSALFYFYFFIWGLRGRHFSLHFY